MKRFNNFRVHSLLGLVLLSIVLTGCPPPVEEDENSVTDIEGNIYKKITIGSQIWMAENLKTTKFKDGAAIPLVTDNTVWSKLSTPGYCWYNGDATTNKNTYGALYNWFTVNTGKLCPTGWHVPNDVEWHTLVLFLDASADYNSFYESYAAGSKLKETGTAHWLSPNADASNASGFTALPSGSHLSDGTFDNIGYGGFWWTSTENTAVGARYRALNCNNSNVYKQGIDKKQGFSVRCLKD